MRAALVLLAVLALSPAAAAEKSAAKPAAAAPKLVCTSERSTGSHLRRRTCQTEAQRDARRKADQEAMERMKGPAQANEVTR